MAAQLIASGVQMALPVLGSLMLADITLGLLARVAPQVQVFFLGLPLKIGLGMLVISFTFAFAFPILQNIYSKLGTGMLSLIAR
jgi:flagellar biosynthetic protein FliR